MNWNLGPFASNTYASGSCYDLTYLFSTLSELKSNAFTILSSSMPFGPLYLTFIIKTLVKSVRWGVLHIPLPISTIFQYVFVIVCYTNGDGSKVERGHTLVESPVEIRIIFIRKIGGVNFSQVRQPVELWQHIKRIQLSHMPGCRRWTPGALISNHL